MSNIEVYKQVKDVVESCEYDFNKLALIHGAVEFEREASFALQILKAQDYSLTMAHKNKDALRMAIINVAAIGLSLSPVKKLAYLIPRKGKVCLDISYQGYIQLALDAKSIKWAKAELVYEKDEFVAGLFGEKPIHKPQPFQTDRGSILGGYCIVKTFDNDFLTEYMSIDEIYNIRDRSESYKSGKGGPWKTDEGEMIKKTIIRRAYKSWPMTDTRKEQFEKALEATQDLHEIDITPVIIKKDNPELIAKLVDVRGKLVFLNKVEADSLEYLARICQRKLNKLEDLTLNELIKFEAMLDSHIDKLEVESEVEKELELETDEKEVENEDSKAS